MGEFKIFATDRFQKDLRKLCKTHPQLQLKLENYVYAQLKTEPHFGLNIKKLKNWHPDTWRTRIGDWRFFYEIDDKKKVVFMITIENRKDAY